MSPRIPICKLRAVMEVYTALPLFRACRFNSPGGRQEIRNLPIAYPCGSLETSSVLPVLSGSDAVDPETVDAAILAQLAPADNVTGGSWVDVLRRLAGRGSGGGASSVSSTVMSRVANFLGPWRWKSMEVRSAFDWVTTPRPYWKCLMYWPCGSVCI